MGTILENGQTEEETTELEKEPVIGIKFSFLRLVLCKS